MINEKKEPQLIEHWWNSSKLTFRVVIILVGMFVAVWSVKFWNEAKEMDISSFLIEDASSIEIQKKAEWLYCQKEKFSDEWECDYKGNWDDCPGMKNIRDKLYEHSFRERKS